MAMFGTSAIAGGTTPSSTTARVCCGIAARVVLRDARAVGAAEDVHPRVAERRTHRVEVAHGDARRVELRAAGERRQAGRCAACAVLRAGSRRPRARRPACRSRGGWSRRCRAGPPSRGRARAGCRRRPKGAARSRGSIPGPARRRRGRAGRASPSSRSRGRPRWRAGCARRPGRPGPPAPRACRSAPRWRRGRRGRRCGRARAGSATSPRAPAGESSAPRTNAASSSAREWLRSLMRVLRILEPSHAALR